MKKKFAEGICFHKLFVIFIACSIFGTVYEQIYHLINHFIRTGVFEWAIRQSVIYGPFNFIYGIGGLLMVCLLVPLKDSWKMVYGLGSLLGGAIEYLMSLFQELIFGTVSWDYHDRLLNIDGRTTLPYMLFWGLLCVFVVYKMYPFLSNLIEKIPVHAGTIFVNILAIIVFLDSFITLVALVRQDLRSNGEPAYTFVGEICDMYYTDEYLNRIYHNAHKIERK